MWSVTGFNEHQLTAATNTLTDINSQCINLFTAFTNYNLPKQISQSPNGFISLCHLLFNSFIPQMKHSKVRLEVNHDHLVLEIPSHHFNPNQSEIPLFTYAQTNWSLRGKSPGFEKQLLQTNQVWKHLIHLIQRWQHDLKNVCSVAIMGKFLLGVPVLNNMTSSSEGNTNEEFGRYAKQIA